MQFKRKTLRKFLFLTWGMIMVFVVVLRLIFSFEEHNSPLLPSGWLSVFLILLVRDMIVLYVPFTFADMLKEILLLSGEDADKTRFVLSAVSFGNALPAIVLYSVASSTATPTVGEILLFSSIAFAVVSVVSEIIIVLRALISK